MHSSETAEGAKMWAWHEQWLMAVRVSPKKNTVTRRRSARNALVKCLHPLMTLLTIEQRDSAKNARKRAV